MSSSIRNGQFSIWTYYVIVLCANNHVFSTVYYYALRKTEIRNRMFYGKRMDKIFDLRKTEIWKNVLQHRMFTLL